MAGAETDTLVAGGGVVGLTTALALAKEGLSVALVEARESASSATDSSNGIRAWALAQSSWDFLYDLGLGQELRTISSPIWDMRVVEAHPLRGVDGRKLHVSHRDVALETAHSSGKTAGARPLGCIVEERSLLALLMKAVLMRKDIRYESGLRVVDFDSGAVGIDVMARAAEDLPAPSGSKPSFERCFRTRLLLACDGRHSVVRDRAGILCHRRDYAQRALVCTLRHEREHGGVAVEWFMPSGTFASLPMRDRCSGIVWCDSPDRVERFVSMDESDFMRHVFVRFGSWLGDLSLCGSRVSYPVSLSFARRYVSDRVALLGDSAHAIHPLAGQGLNLGLRDVSALVDAVREGLSLGEDIGGEGLLLRYERSRRFDVKKLVMLTDGLQRLFGNDNGVLRAMRLGGMGLLDSMSGVKRRMANAAAGV